MTESDLKNSDVVIDSKGIRIGNEYIAYKDGGVLLRDSIKELAQRITAKKILEVGYGYGYTARAIQEYFKPKLHIIVEANAGLALFARMNLGQSVQVVEEMIQKYVTDEEFDLIYDDREERVDIIPINWSKIRHKYWATCCHPPAGIEDMNSEFLFASEGGQYFQHLHRPDEIYF